jgi:hypothetical protein
MFHGLYLYFSPRIYRGIVWQASGVMVGHGYFSSINIGAESLLKTKRPSSTWDYSSGSI